MVRLAFFMLFLLTFSSCGDSKNYNDAYIVKEHGQLFIKLTGKRPVNSHNPGDIISRKTYYDSLMIPMAILKDGVIKGEDIPMKEGYYKYKGKIMIKGKIVEVDLFLDNYDDKQLEPLSWNGKYNLQKRDNE